MQPDDAATEEERQRMESFQHFLIDDGGVVASAATLEEALAVLRGRMAARPSLFGEAQVKEVLWTLDVFSKSLEDLLGAFLAHAAVRAERTAVEAGAGEAGARSVVVGYDCDKAYQRLEIYAELLSAHRQLLQVDPPLAPETMASVEAVLNRTVWVMDAPAASGGLVLLFALSRFNLQKLLSTPGVMVCFSRYLFFMLHSFIFDPDCQEHGLVCVNDYHNFNFSDFLSGGPKRPPMSDVALRRREVHVCVYVCIYIHTHTCIYRREVHVCVYVCIYIYTHTCDI